MRSLFAPSFCILACNVFAQPSLVLGAWNIIAAPEVTT